MGVDLLSNTNIYKCTYAELIEWVRELSARRRIDNDIHERLLKQAARIMELEFDLRKYSAMMVDDKQETVVKQFSIPENNVVSSEEFAQLRRKKGGSRGTPEDWLTDMVWGTIFYVRQKPVTTGSRSWLLQKFIKAGNQKNVVLIVPMHANEEVISDDREWLPVEPKAFCRNYELISEFEPVPIETLNE